MNSVVEASAMKTPMEQVDDLKYWLATAPCNWESDQNIRRYLLPTGESISCVLWNSLYHITGTDIVRSLVFRFQAFGRPVKNIKKFEEGVFSDLRNLKPGTDASLEEPKSEFLEMLYKNNCIRTQKKQKVFYWFSVPHDRLFLDALERDLKREKMGTEPTTFAVAEPALSFSFDSTQSLYDQFTKGVSPSSSADSSPRIHSLVYDPSIPQLTPAIIKTDDAAVLYSINEEAVGNNSPSNQAPSLVTFALCHPIPQCDSALTKAHHLYSSPDLGYCSMDELQKTSFENPTTEYFASSTSPWDGQYDDGHNSSDDLIVPSSTTTSSSVTSYGNPASATATNLFGMFSIFEGSPSYKQRRRRANSCTSLNVNNIDNNNGGNGLNSPPARTNAAPYQIKTYTCPLPTCGRLFKRLEHLKRHVRTHTMERPYSCTVCGKRFSRSDNLAQHRKTHERGLNNSPAPSDDGSNNSDIGYDDNVNNNGDCYYETTADLSTTCVDGLAVFAEQTYPMFNMQPAFLEGSVPSGILV